MFNLRIAASSIGYGLGILGLSLLTACQSNKSATTMPSAAVDARPTIRIDAGSATPYKDPTGNVWLADVGFDGGDVVDRGDDTAIAGTTNPAIYRTEHWGMTGFSYPVANGKYTVKLHFAETSDAVNAIGDRIFSAKIGDHEIKDLDVWAKAGARQKAWVETVPVEISNGKVEIAFTSNVQETEINGIEIIPR